MIISRDHFIELVIGFLEGDEECARAMADAYTKKKPIWEKDEWIYVKDIEMCLKGIYKIHKKGGFDDFRSVKRLILDEEDRTESISDCWIRERIRDCRTSLEGLRFVRTE